MRSLGVRVFFLASLVGSVDYCAMRMIVVEKTSSLLGISLIDSPVSQEMVGLRLKRGGAAGGRWGVEQGSNAIEACNALWSERAGGRRGRATTGRGEGKGDAEG
jgi:hypothetical protein